MTALGQEQRSRRAVVGNAPEEWRKDALCAQVGWHLFDGPEFGHWNPHHLAQEAKKVCATCPVRDACLASTLAYERGMGARARQGIFGGLGPSARARLDDTVPQGRKAG